MRDRPGSRPRMWPTKPATTRSGWKSRTTQSRAVAQGPARVAFASLLRRPGSRVPVVVGIVSLGLSLVYIPCAARWQATGVAVASTLVHLVQASLVLGLWRWVGAVPTGDDRGAVDGPGLGTETSVA